VVKAGLRSLNSSQNSTNCCCSRKILFSSLKQHNTLSPFKEAIQWANTWKGIAKQPQKQHQFKEISD